MSRFSYAKLNNEEETEQVDIQMEPLNNSDNVNANETIAVNGTETVVENSGSSSASATVAVGASVASSSSASSSVPSTNATTTAIGAGADGVFANVAKTASASGHVDNLTSSLNQLPPKYEDDTLPTYGDVYRGTTPPSDVFGTVIITNSSDQNDLLVDGMPVGNGFTFILTTLVAWLFGVFGFLCAYLLSTTHAGRCGARAGIGLQLIHWGIYMRSYMNQYDWYSDSGNGSDSNVAIGSSSNNNSFGETLDNFPMPLWLSYVFMLAGWFIFVRACLSLFHARRTLHMRLAGIAN